MSQQIAALLKPKPRDSEITTTSAKTKFGFVQVVDFQNIGVKDVTLRANGITRDVLKVKVSLA
jgi:hypothetical protein